MSYPYNFQVSEKTDGQKFDWKGYTERTLHVLTLDDTVRQARSLNYAKALAPLMFANMGTRMMFKKIRITDENGTLVGLFGRFGWEDK